MKDYKYPDMRAGEILIKEFGGNPDKALICQDWEYTYPKKEDLGKYVARYREEKTTAEEKRVLCSFIFEACEDILCDDYSKNEKTVREILKMLFNDIKVNKYEFDFWSSWDTEKKEDRFYIAELAREFNVKVEDD